jgi:hypothetical protein
MTNYFLKVTQISCQDMDTDIIFNLKEKGLFIFNHIYMILS